MTGRALRAEHTQLVYMKRFTNQKEALSRMTLDDLYEERFRRARWRLPVMHFGAKMASEVATGSSKPSAHVVTDGTTQGKARTVEVRTIMGGSFPAAE